MSLWGMLPFLHYVCTVCLFEQYLHFWLCRLYSRALWHSSLFLCEIFVRDIFSWLPWKILERKKMSERSFNNKCMPEEAGILSLFDIPSKPISKICQENTYFLISWNLQVMGYVEKTECIRRFSYLMLLLL